MDVLLAKRTSDKENQETSSVLNKCRNAGKNLVWHRHFSVKSSVADPGCSSRIPDPDFYPSRIPDPKTATKERGEKKLDVKPFYVDTKFNKIVNYFSFEVLKKNLGQFSKNYRTFTKKIV
jgi:hypothetical protein